MGNKDEHCRYTFERYGVTGEDIHKWMDEPAKISNVGHRKYRHIPSQSVPKMFIEKYGFHLARYIIIDHILLDKAKGDSEAMVLRSLEGSNLSVNDVAKRIGRSRS